jgi:hypothetical protein
LPNAKRSNVRTDAAQGNGVDAGCEFVREEIHHVREGKARRAVDEAGDRHRPVHARCSGVKLRQQDQLGADSAQAKRDLAKESAPLKPSRTPRARWKARCAAREAAPRRKSAEPTSHASARRRSASVRPRP